MFLLIRISISVNWESSRSMSRDRRVGKARSMWLLGILSRCPHRHRLAISKIKQVRMQTIVLTMKRGNIRSLMSTCLASIRTRHLRELLSLQLMSRVQPANHTSTTPREVVRARRKKWYQWSTLVTQKQTVFKEIADLMSSQSLTRFPWRQKVHNYLNLFSWVKASSKRSRLTQQMNYSRIETRPMILSRNSIRSSRWGKT